MATEQASTYVHNESWASFRSDMLKHTLLTEPETRELVKAYQDDSGDSQKALNKLMRHNARFVFNIAKAYAKVYEPDFWEYFNEGCCGLVKAAKRFELDKDVTFLTYAVWWIRQFMSKYKFECGSLVRVGPNARKEMKLAYLASLPKDAPEHKLVAKNGLRAVYITTDVYAMSLDAPNPNTGNDATFIDSLPDTNTEQPNIEFNTLQTVLDKLTDRERDILLRYFGVYTGEEQTLKDIGQLYGMSKERIRQLKDIALRKVRAGLGTRQVKLHEFDFTNCIPISNANEQEREFTRLEARIAKQKQQYACGGTEVVA